MADPYVSSRAQIVADSVGPNDVRLTTFECEYPRYIHAEVMTHRALSRCGRSSRAEPIRRVIERSRTDPVRPLVWMYDAKRMANGIVMTDEDAARSELLWWEARDSSARIADQFLSLGMHRQYVTRILEPFLRIKMIYTATSFDNFFALRIHPDPMPDIQQLAVTMGREYLAGQPVRLQAGEWHLPYVTERERSDFPVSVLVKVSTSRCARISYDSLDGKTVPLVEDARLHDQLVAAHPKHASPAEHQAMATGDSDIRSGNFRGWVQYRHTIPQESISDFDLAARLVEYERRDYIL